MGFPGGRIFAAALLASACTLAAADELSDARDLIKRGEAARAFGLLEPLERSRAGDVDFDYLLGTAAYDAGRYDRAVVAFERVLLASPGFFSARFDLARTYYALGADDLAQQEFERLLKANPTPEGVRAINAHLAAIEARRKGPQRRWKAYVEAGGGHDSNLSSTTPDFTNAIGGAFGIPGVVPTGNSILRSAPFWSLNGGVAGGVPFGGGWEAIGAIDLKGRNYTRYGEFDYRMADLQAGVLWGREATSVQVTAVGQAYRQDGDAPAAADGSRALNDRNAGGVNLEARHALGGGWEGFAIAQWMRLKYPSNATQDTDQAYASAGVLRPTRGAWPGMFLASVFYSHDSARSDSDGTSALDVGRKTAGIRGYAQRDFARGAYCFLYAGYSVRRDDGAFARATTIEYGRDKLLEVSAGGAIPWGRWSLRPGVTWLHNDSNIDLYSFKRTEGSLMVRYEFP
jgi:tetratricopeptide (TPR) repeat protein